MSISSKPVSAPDTLAHRLAAQHFDFSDGQLSIDGISASDLATEFGTPLFVYSARVMRESLAALRDATHNEVDVYYSVKANPNPSVIRVFADEGAGAEIASGAEYEYARRAGVEPARIIFAGPGKSTAELKHVISNGIGEIHVEAEDELDRIVDIAASASNPVHVSIRVNPTEAAQGGSMRMGGKPAQFGIDEERLTSVVTRYGNNPALEIAGVHMFAGTQVLDAETLLAQWRHGFSVATDLARLLNRPLKTIDLGGGLGIPYFANESALCLDTVKQGFPALINEVRANTLLKDAKIIVEPGRYLVGPSGVYLAGTISAKASRGMNFAITDGGMHHHLAASGNLGQVIKRDYPLMTANRAFETHDQAVTVVGPLCTPLDTFGRKTPMPVPRVNDIVAIFQSGAYGLTASPVGFLSQPVPAEVLIDNAVATVIRPRGTFDNPFTQPNA
jgi:diaminopimelate decarboxylase